MVVSTSPPASRAGKVEAKRKRPGRSVQYKGLMPNRSRPSSTWPLSCSHRANANMPFSRETKSSPQAW